MAYGLLRSLLPCSWFGFWVGRIRYLSKPVSPFLPSSDAETNNFTFPGSQPKSYPTMLMNSPLSPLSSFSPLDVSTCSSALSSVNQPKLNVPSALGALRSKVFSQPPRTTARSSSTTTLLPQPLHLLARKHLTSSAKIRLLLTDHGRALKSLDMDLEDRERKQLLFEDSSYRSLSSRCRGT